MEDDFQNVKLKINAHVFIEQGNTCEVKVKAPEIVLNEIITVVEKETLVIKYKSLTSWKKLKNKIPRDGIQIYLTMEDVEGLAVAGSGDIIAKGLIESDGLSLSVTGSGDIHLSKLMADDLSVGIAGSGNVKIDGGSVDDFAVSIKGSGDLNAQSLEIDDANVKIAGSGSCKLGESDDIHVSIAGSGDLFYKGDPDITKKVAGSGSIKRMK